VHAEPLPLGDRLVTGRRLPDWLAAASSLRRSLKLFARGDRERARRLLVDGMTTLRVPPPAPPDLGEALDRLAVAAPAPVPLHDPIDIIVPVHNGIDHLERLFATLFTHTAPHHRVLLVDDGSNDQEVAPLLARAAARRPNVRVMTNPANLGFIATVNVAMRATSGHAAILNSDTEVPPRWLERLFRPIQADPRVASATPFSNAAAMFSFPAPDQDHDLPPGLGVDEIDRAFARLGPQSGADLAAPTAIGFCMAINRDAWSACGAFDQGTFGRGYCEETDWCLRTAGAGWQHVLVPDLFVYHTHGGTFASQERRQLMEENLAVLHRRWPGYYPLLAAFRRRDPWLRHRAAALLALATTADARPVLMHGEADGREIAQALAEGRGVVSVGPARPDGGLDLEVRRGPWRVAMTATQEAVGRLTSMMALMEPRAA
jgi:GT2 family glycosyltransferase